MADLTDEGGDRLADESDRTLLDESDGDMAVQTTATVAPCGTIVFVNFVDTSNSPPTPVSIVGEDGSSSNYYPFRTTRFDATKTGLSVTVNGTPVAFRGGQPLVLNAFSNIDSRFTLLLATAVQASDTVAVTVPAGLVQLADGNGGFVLSPALSVTLTNGQSLYTAGTSQNLAGKGYRALMAKPNLGPKVNLKRYGWNRDTPIASVAPNCNNLWKNSVPAFGTPTLTSAMLTADGYLTSSAPLPTSFDFISPGTGGGNPPDNASLPVDAGKYTAKYQANAADDWTWDDTSAVKLSSTNTGSEFVDVWALPPGRSLKGKVRAAGVSNVRVTHAKTTTLDSQFGHPLSLMQCQGAKALRYMIADDIPSTGVQHYSEYGQTTARGFANDGTACSDVYNITNWETLDAAHVGNYGGQMVYRVTFDRNHSLLNAAFTTLGANDSSGNNIADPTVPILHLTFTGTLKAGVAAGTATTGSMVIGPTSPGVVVASQLARSGMTLAANQCFWATGALFTDTSGNILNPENYDDFTVTVAFPQAGAGTTLKLSRAFERVPAPDLWCNDVNQLDDCWLWVNIPPAADDALIHTLAQKIAVALSSGRKVIVEYGNEVWNSADPYFTTQFCYGILSWDTLTTTGDPFQTVTPRIVAIHEIFQSEFVAAGRPATDVVRMFGAFAASATPTYATCTYLANNNLTDKADAFCIAPYVTAGPNAWIANPYGLTATVTAVGTNAFTVDHANFNNATFAPAPTTGLPLYFDVTRSGAYLGTKVVTGITAGTGSTGVLATAGTYNRGKQGLPAYDVNGTGLDFAVQVGDVITPNVQGAVNQLTIDEVVDMRTRSLADNFSIIKGQVDANLSSIQTLLGSDWPGFMAGYEGGITGCDLSDCQFVNALYSQAMVHDPSGYWIDLWYHDVLDAAGFALFVELYLCGGFIGEQGYATTYNKYQWPGMAPGIGDGSDGLFNNRGVLRAWLDSGGNPVGNPFVMPLSQPLVSPFGAATNLTNALCGLQPGAKHVLTGPVSGVQGSPIGPFTVTLLDGVTLGTGVTLVANVAVGDPDGGTAPMGSWSGSNVVTLSDATRSAQTAGSWTPSSAGNYTRTNAGTVAFTAAANTIVSGTPTSVPTPPRLRATVLSAQPSAAFAKIIPPMSTDLTPGSASGAFTFSLGPDGSFPSASGTVQLSDGGVGGTFFDHTSAAVTSLPISPSAAFPTFTYAPPVSNVGGAVLLSATLSGYTPASHLVNVVSSGPVANPGVSALFSNCFFEAATGTTLAAGSSSAAAFVEVDTPANPGNWTDGSTFPLGHGSLGAFIYNAALQLPAGVTTAGPNGQVGGINLGTTSDTRALRTPDGSSRTLFWLTSDHPRGSDIYMQVAVGDQVLRLSTYICNLDSGFFNSVTVLLSTSSDPADVIAGTAKVIQGTLLSQGSYVVWDVTGTVYIHVINNAYLEASKLTILSGPTSPTVGTQASYYVALDQVASSPLAVTLQGGSGWPGGTSTIAANQSGALVTLTPGSAATRNLTTTNTGGMTDAPNYAVTAGTGASTVTLSYSGSSTVMVGDTIALTLAQDGTGSTTAYMLESVDGAFAFDQPSYALTGTTPVTVHATALAQGPVALTAYNTGSLLNAGEVDLTVQPQAAAFTLSVTRGITGTTASAVATGSQTNWTTGTTFSIAGGTGASISGLSVNATDQTAAFTIHFGTAAGTLTVSDTTDAATASVTVHTPLIAGTLAAVPGDSTVALTESGTSGGFTPYTRQVWRSTVSGQQGTALMGATTNPYTATGLTNGTTYYFSEVITDDLGNSVTTPQVSGVPVPNAPLAPTNLTATPGAGKVSLAWNASTGATLYKILRGSATGGESMTPVGTTSSTAFDDVLAPAGVASYYEVLAHNAGGDSPASNEASATPGASSGGGASATDLIQGLAQAGVIVVNQGCVIAPGGFDQVQAYGIPVRKIAGLILSALVAKLSNVPTEGSPGLVKIRDVLDLVDAIQIEVDGNGNRLSLTLQAPN